MFSRKKTTKNLNVRAYQKNAEAIHDCKLELAKLKLEIASKYPTGHLKKIKGKEEKKEYKRLIGKLVVSTKALEAAKHVISKGEALHLNAKERAQYCKHLILHGKMKEVEDVIGGGEFFDCLDSDGNIFHWLVLRNEDGFFEEKQSIIDRVLKAITPPKNIRSLSVKMTEENEAGLTPIQLAAKNNKLELLASLFLNVSRFHPKHFSGEKHEAILFYLIEGWRNVQDNISDAGNFKYFKDFFNRLNLQLTDYDDKISLINHLSDSANEVGYFKVSTLLQKEKLELKPCVSDKSSSLLNELKLNALSQEDKPGASPFSRIQKMIDSAPEDVGDLTLPQYAESLKSSKRPSSSKRSPSKLSKCFTPSK